MARGATRPAWLLPDGNAERRSGRVYPAEGSAGTGSLF